MAEHGSAKEAVARHEVREPPPRSHLEWTGRVRVHVSDPRRYTRFVAIIKRTLLFAALALIAVLIVYSLLPREQNRVAMSFERLSKITNDLAMIKPRLSGTDASGNLYVVTADAAIQDGTNARRARLRNVQADITLKNGGWLSASAGSGQLDIDAKKLVLSDNIAIYTDSGYELHAKGVTADLGKGIMRGDKAVNGQGPLGTLHADRFEIDHKGKLIRFLGHVKMMLYTSRTKHP